MLAARCIELKVGTNYCFFINKTTQRIKKKGYSGICFKLFSMWRSNAMIDRQEGIEDVLITNVFRVKT